MFTFGSEIQLPSRDGVVPGVDFRRSGQGVLLAHGGHNVAAWGGGGLPPGQSLPARGVDLRGHGQARLDSSGPEQYWQDFGDVAASLGWDRSVLVGHFTGGYAVTAATAVGQGWWTPLRFALSTASCSTGDHL